MPTKKTITKKSNGERSNYEPPDVPERYLALDNLPATKPVPKELTEESQRVKIYLPAKGKEAPKLIKSRKIANVWELELHHGIVPGLPGLNAARLSHQDVTREIKTSVDSEPFRPAWVDYTPHPKMATVREALLRRVDGRWIQPHYGVFGPDDRQVYYPSGYPWTCIGRISVWDDFSKPNPAWSGSGVLIGGRVVLTAGHMAPWGSNNWAMQFVPAYYDGASVLGSGVSSWVSDYYGYQDPVSAWDMIVCRLYTPLGNSYGYFGAKTYSSSWEGGNYWTLAGYPAAIAGTNRPSRQMWWQIVDDDSDGSADELEYYADQTPGDSGGPVFGFWSGQPYAIGTASGGQKETFLWWTTEDDNVAAGGSAMVDLIRWARGTWT
jgi:V8-like Glu-specific endopeptidase